MPSVIFFFAAEVQEQRSDPPVRGPQDPVYSPSLAVCLAQVLSPLMRTSLISPRSPSFKKCHHICHHQFL